MRFSWACVIALCSLSLSGCSVVPGIVTTETSSNAAYGAAIQGVVHGGQQPIVGASVYLYAVGTSGYGGASVSLLTSGSNTAEDGNGNYYVTTDSNGAFTITGDYTCPSTASQVFLYSVGGNPGAGTNSGAGLLAGLGTCPANGTLSSSVYVVVNEVSTIATAYVIGGFSNDPLTFSTSGTTLSKTGLANAFATIVNLETLSTGTALATTPAGNGTVPQSRINTLANILAACINSSGPTSTACTTLFDDTQRAGSPSTDTAMAAVILARNASSADVSALYPLQTGTSPFQPSLSSAPNDFTIAINYSGGGLAGPAGLAVDASGNIWVANASGSNISEFGPTGAVLSGSSGYTSGGVNAPVGIAIDGSSNVWVTNNKNNSISELNSSGAGVAGSPFTGGGLDGAFGIAIDPSSHVWVANQNNNSISEFNSGGSAISGSGGITTGGLDSPLTVAVDVSGNVWVSNNSGTSLSEFNSSGTANASSPFSGGGLNDPGGIAIDSSGNLWAANNTGTSVSELSSSGSPVTGSPFTGGGLSAAYDVAIGGQNDVWVTNNGGNSISKFNSTNGSADTGSGGDTAGGVLNGPYAIAVDGAANVWVTNYGNASGTTITEFVGASAGPVVTPMVANLLSPYGAHAVNKP